VIKISFTYCLIFFLVSCLPNQKREAIVIKEEICKFVKRDKENYLICDEDYKIKVNITSGLSIHELNNCKRVRSTIQNNNGKSNNDSIVCKTKFGYEVIQ
jgi:hypothetical protein